MSSTVLVVVAVWFVMSVPFAILTGKFIKAGGSTE